MKNTSLDRIRFMVLERRVDFTPYTKEYIEWHTKVTDINNNVRVPDEPESGDANSNLVESDGGLTLDQKFNFGIISEEQYYSEKEKEMMSNLWTLPERPPHKWGWAKTVLDLEQVSNFMEYKGVEDEDEDDDTPKTVVYKVGGNCEVYRITFDKLYHSVLEYREQKHGQQDFIKLLSELQESESGEGWEDTRS